MTVSGNNWKKTNPLGVAASLKLISNLALLSLAVESRSTGEYVPLQTENELSAIEDTELSYSKVMLFC